MSHTCASKAPIINGQLFLDKKSLLCLLSAIFSLMIIATGCTNNSETMQLELVSQGMQLDGDFYINEEYIGTSEDSVLLIPKSNLKIGKLTIVLEHNGRSLSYTYGIVESDLLLDYFGLNLSEEILEDYQMNFIIGETGIPLDSSVFLNSKYLGDTTRGTLHTNIRDLFPGTISFNGTYNGTPFEFTAKFVKDDLGLQTYTFTVSEEELANLKFDSSAYDADIIERILFGLMNDARYNNNLPLFKRNEHLDVVAQEYANQIFISGYFHTDLEGKSVGDRIKDKKIYYSTAAETLDHNVVTARTKPSEVAVQTVEGWLASPGHRNALLDRDELYTTVGVGVACRESECYSVAVYAGGLEESYTDDLPGGYCYSFKLYNAVNPFNYTTLVQIDLESEYYLNAYVVSDPSDLNRCGLKYVYEVHDFFGTKAIHEVFTVSPGYTLIVETLKNGKIELDLSYYPIYDEVKKLEVYSR